MKIQTVNDLLERVARDGEKYPKYAGTVRDLLIAYPGGDSIGDTDAYSTVRSLVSYQTQVESTEDWSQIINIDIDPDDLAPDGKERFLADPLGWLDFWDPITTALGTWESWWAESDAQEREALDEAVRRINLSVSLESYVRNEVPEDVEAWPVHYQPLLDLTRTI